MKLANFVACIINATKNILDIGPSIAIPMHK